MRVYREILPNSYLLILTTDEDPSLYSLREALHRASRSGRPNIWVDCSQMDYLEESVLALVTREANRLRASGIQVILCHPPASWCMPAPAADPTAELLVASSLLDAAAIRL